MQHGFRACSPPRGATPFPSMSPTESLSSYLLVPQMIFHDVLLSLTALGKGVSMYIFATPAWRSLGTRWAAGGAR